MGGLFSRFLVFCSFRALRMPLYAAKCLFWGLFCASSACFAVLESSCLLRFSGGLSFAGRSSTGFNRGVGGSLASVNCRVASSGGVSWPC